LRCTFTKGKQRELLLFAKALVGLSWRDFAQKIGVGYTTLREWRDEKWSIRFDIFEKIINLCPECRTFQDSIIRTNEDNWGRKLGGLHTKERQHGFLDPKYQKQSLIWKSKGGKIGTKKWHERMKKEKPQEYRQIQYDRIKQSLKYKYEYQGQKYRNLLELETAKILAENGFQFKYEKLLRCEEKFYFPDFVLNKAIIECTFWHKVEEKAIELAQKILSFQMLSFKMIIIITTPKYLEDYSKLLKNLDVRVITLDGLSGLLDGKIGRVKRA
jgi:hypothetical protein